MEKQVQLLFNVAHEFSRTCLTIILTHLFLETVSIDISIFQKQWTYTALALTGSHEPAVRCNEEKNGGGWKV